MNTLSSWAHTHPRRRRAPVARQHRWRHRGSSRAQVAHGIRRIHPPQRRDTTHASSTRHPRAIRNCARPGGGGGASPRLTKLRPFATAGATLLGAGLVVFSPPSLGHAPGLAALREVTLTAGDTGLPDLLAPWIDQFNTASENATKLLNTFYEAPGIGTQQMLANMSAYLQDFFNDPTSSSVTSASHEIEANLAAVLTGYGLQNADAATTATVLSHTLECATCLTGHGGLFGQIPGYIPADEQAAALPIINFIGSPESGIIMGMLGPGMSPWVALGNSIADGDDFNTTLANMVGAFFNGADLNLDSLLPTINGLGLFPAGMNMSNLDIAFGGLLSPGSVGPNVGGDAVGGSIFNSVGIHFTGVPLIGAIDAPSEPVGPIGALEGWGQTIADLLGWSGTGSPLADVTLPLIPDDFLDPGAGASSAVADLSSLWQDLVSALGL
ncbi:outer membrane porin GjpA [[Mycobacterium] vasticus]|uniref:Outer membrane porin GjpA n=1 Tax=[Mycobacterium] vasticus TaxID=2875777 RepID=A0ABU5YZF8_9MYCO|nr:outer membrane porin GjpA [Mycolicibacter sp. MYC017]MEB3070525.1 outer membrane porin GjpA [Mycolicibacter sp. MYC017]